MKLHGFRFTPIRDVVAATPGYHMAPSGFVYSDRYSIEDIRRIGWRIKQEFYTPMQVARSLGKLIRTGMFRGRDLAMLPFRLPWGFYNWRKSLRRMRRSAARAG